jgi:glycerol-3-phosphate acyltransferase PlsY
MIDYTLPVLAYLFGSVSSAIIVCKFMGLPDPTTSGSNNPGATNVLRIGGKKAAIITLIGDVLKGLIPMLVAGQITTDSRILALCGLGAFLGHLFPLFFGFKGGKGVATAIGVFIGISWQLSLILFGFWICVAAVSRYSSLAALSTAAIAPGVVYWLLHDWSFVLLACVIAICLFWRHSANISRLRQGTESKISIGKK